jgi:hypothetical protein
MPQVCETYDKISFTESVPNGLRIFLFFIGFLPFLAPYGLLVRPNWKEFSLHLIFLIIVSLAAIAVGIAIMLVGILGLNQTLCFEFVSQTISYSYTTAITPLRKIIYKFHDVVDLDIKLHDWSEGPSTYGLRVRFADARRIEVGSFAERGEAERYLYKIKNLIQPESKVHQGFAGVNVKP